MADALTVRPLPVLAADIGGTHARIALVSLERGRPVMVRAEKYKSAQFDSLESVVETFLKDVAERPERACFALAGPVVEGEAQLSNLDWVVRQNDLERSLGIPVVRLINDFSAIGYAIPFLGPDDYTELQAGEPDPDGPIAVIGPGTGLGHGFLLRQGERRRVLASEGGHADFAPVNDEEYALAGFLRDRYGRASWERVVSGPGLADTYEFLASRYPDRADPAVAAEMREKDPAAVVSGHALAGTDALASRALDIFVRALGAQAGNLALAIVATGGIYVGGGIAPRIMPRLRDGAFVSAINNKGRLADLVKAMPVRVITNPDTGLLGAGAAVGSRQ